MFWSQEIQAALIFVGRAEPDCNSNVYSLCLVSLAALCHEPNLGNPGVRLSVQTFVRGGGDSVQPQGRGLTRPSAVPRAGPKVTVRSWRHRLRDLGICSTFQQRCRAGAAASLSRDSRVPRPNAGVAAGAGCPTSEVWGGILECNYNHSSSGEKRAVPWDARSGGGGDVLLCYFSF